jgi:Domain of unknown function (DUF4126)
LSGAAYTGHVSLNESFAWLGTAAMMIAKHSDYRGNSGLLQPGVDNLLDTLAMKSAVVAGTIALAATMTDLQPMLNWTTAVLAGGEVAGITQALTVMLRKIHYPDGWTWQLDGPDGRTRRCLADFAAGPCGAAYRASGGYPDFLVGISFYSKARLGICYPLTAATGSSTNRSVIELRLRQRFP